MISIIIPVLNEAPHITEHLRAFQALKGQFEIIVVDGGSQDQTVNLANACLEAPHKVISSDTGRAKQLNKGASIAEGHTLWFVHLDSQLHPNSPLAIEHARSNGYRYGCFSLFFYDSQHLFMKFVAFTSRLRARQGKWLFGDQGIFIQKAFFDQINGFPQIPIMEDLAFSTRAREYNKPKVLKLPIGTSARRFHHGGMLKTFLKMQKLKLDYLRGVSTHTLLQQYEQQ